MTGGSMSRNHRKNERGVALILVLIALMIVSAIGVGMLYSADTETTINRNFRDEQKVNASALAGLQEARERMRDPGLGTGVYIPPPTAIPSGTAANWSVYILNPAAGDTVDPWSAASAFPDSEICSELIFGTGTTMGNPCGVGSGTDYSWRTTTTTSGGFQMPGMPLDYKWVRINRKLNGATRYLIGSGTGLTVTAVTTPPTDPVCFDGSRQIPLSALTTAWGYTECNQPLASNAVMPEYSNVYLLTSYAQTTGSSPARRMVQMEVAPLPPILTGSAVMTPGQVNLEGTLQINGYDNCSCSCNPTGTGATAVGNCVSRTDKICDADGHHPAIFAGSSVDAPISSETIVSGATTTIQQNMPWPSYYNIDTWVNRYLPTAVSIGTCSGGNCSVPNNVTMGGLPDNFQTNFAPDGDPTGNFVSQVTYVNGNVTFNGGSGSGILIVNGDMDIHGGGFQFYGLIIVTGQLSFTGGGSVQTNIVGGVLAGEQAYDTTNLGGSAVIKYDVCAMDRNRKGQPFVQLGTREIPF